MTGLLELAQGPMRRAAGCINQLAPCLALLALAACSSATPAPEPRPAAEETCELAAIRERAIDSAVVSIHSSIAAANECALRLVAASLRPWRGGSLEPWTVTVATTATADTIPFTVTVRRLRAAQARDALDAESVLVATEDLELVEYAKARDDLGVVALPWDRFYVHVGGDVSSASLGAVDPAAVRAEARRAEPPPECDSSSPPPQTRRTPRSRRAVYLLGDRTARELAERIVGLGNAKEVVGLDSAVFEAALSAGADEAYIVALRLTGDACGALSDLVRRAPWADRASIAHLIETRAYAIMRLGRTP